MTRVKFMTCLFAGLLMGASAAPVEARRDEHSSRREAAQRNGISLDEAVARVRRDTGGRVLSAEAREYRGRTSYRIKVLLRDGSVRVVNVDAQSGEIR
ncbi:MAG TPA: PepSY domain-containing protein [Sulfuricaulis sp.]|nr:PepSY domain-containing protein [Sulfuricaulis sp.]